MKETATRTLATGFASLQEFLRLESAGGLVLMAATAAALIVGNSPLADTYTAVLNLPLEVRLGTWSIAKPLLLWINDGLMAVFFLLWFVEPARTAFWNLVRSVLGR